jgi:hypothetical protein
VISLNRAKKYEYIKNKKTRELDCEAGDREIDRKGSIQNKDKLKINN